MTKQGSPEMMYAGRILAACILTLCLAQGAPRAQTPSPPPSASTPAPTSSPPSNAVSTGQSPLPPAGKNAPVVKPPPHPKVAAKSAPHAAAKKKPAPHPVVVPPPPPPAWESFHLDPKARIKLDFRNSNADLVLQWFSEASGVSIIKNPGFKDLITLHSAGKLSLDDAFAMLDIALRMSNYQIQSQGKFLVVAPLTAGPGASGGPPSGAPGMAGAHGPGMPGPGAPPPGQPGSPVGAPPGGAAPGGASDQQFKVYAIKYASASLLAKAINNVYSEPVTPSQPGQPQQPQPAGPAPATVKVRAVAEEYSNSLVVHAPAKQQAEIAAFVKEVDQPSDQPRLSKVFKLRYATAETLAPVIQSILNNSTALGRSAGAMQNTNQPNNVNYFIFDRQPQQNTNGEVVPDTRTNTLTVTAAKEVLDHVADVIQQLDQPAAYESDTFVYVFKNARADVIANLLNVSFGNHINNGAVGGSLTNTLNSTNSSQSAAGQPPGLTTTANTQNNQGGNGIFGIARGNPPSEETPTTSLDVNGNVVNIRDLTGAVLLVPNIDTNSVIVVTAPENRPLIESVLEQLDVVPEQVMIETLVVEATLDRNDQSGVEWSFTQGKPFGVDNGTANGSSSFGLQSNTAQPQGLFYTLTTPEYGAFLKALRTDTHLRVVSSPRIFTTNNALAQVKIGQSLPYVTNQTLNTDGSTFYSYNFLDVGLVLSLIPRIMSNGCVTMDVTQTANDFVGYTSFQAPIVNERETQTTINVKDGQTAVLGGIIQNTTSSTENKIPILGDLPLLGGLFRSNSTEKDKTELLIFLTPHIVKDPSDIHSLRDQPGADLDSKTMKDLAGLMPKDDAPPAEAVQPAQPAQ